MKKITCILCVAVLLTLFTTAAFAESLDLTKMSLEELKTLQQQIETEIEKREAAGESFQNWYDYGVGMHLPLPKLQSGEEPKLGSFMINDSNMFYASIKNVKDGDFEAYLALLMLYGYTNVEDRSNISFNAYNEEGYKVSLIYFAGAGLSVSADAPKAK